MVLGITLSNNLSCRSIFDANLLLYAKLSYTAFRLSEFSKRTFKARSVEVSPRGRKLIRTSLDFLQMSLVERRFNEFITTRHFPDRREKEKKEKNMFEKNPIVGV